MHPSFVIGRSSASRNGTETVDMKRLELVPENLGPVYLRYWSHYPKSSPYFSRPVCILTYQRL